MAKKVFNPIYSQYSALSTPSDPLKGVLSQPISSSKKTEMEQVLDEMRAEREFAASIPEGPYAPELKEPSISMPAEKPIGLLSDRKYEGGIQEKEGTPLTRAERADIAKSITTGLLTAGKSVMDLEQFKRDAKLKSELEKAKQKFSAAQAGTESQVGNLRNYVANLRAALGG